MIGLALAAALCVGWWSFPARRPGPVDPARQMPARVVWPSVAVIGGVTSAWWLGPIGPCVAMLSLTVGWLIRRRRTAWMARRRREAVVRACQELARELRLGKVPAAGLGACDVQGPFAKAAALQRVGGNVAMLWRAEAAVVGEESKLSVARAWEVSLRTGAPLMAALGQVSVELERDGERRQHLSAELAGPRATSTILACLPIVGMVLGVAVGADPWNFLTSNLFGQVALVISAALTCLGLTWNELMASRVERLR